MSATSLQLTLAGPDDLPALNQVIAAAIMGWQLPERVKRLSLPSYYYDLADLHHLQIWLATDSQGEIHGLAGWEEADAADLPARVRGVLLHGIYVHPTRQGQGIGQDLLAHIEQLAASKHYPGVLVKAQADAVGFFQQQGYRLLPVEDRVRHYSHRLWKALHVNNDSDGNGTD